MKKLYDSSVVVLIAVFVVGVIMTVADYYSNKDDDNKGNPRKNEPLEYMAD